MNSNTNLTCLSFMIGLVMFSNLAVYGQNETVALFTSAENKNISKDVFKSSASERNKYDFCLGMNSEQTHYKSQIGTIKKVGFIDLNDKYYLEDFGINGGNETINSDASQFYTSPIFIAPFLAPNTFLTDPKNPNKTKEFYLYKRKRQNTTGWVLFIGGTAMAVGGIIGLVDNYETFYGNIFGGELTQAEKDKRNRADIFAIVAAAGLLTDLISIPFFISAHHNKRMASSLSLGTQNTNFQQYNSICQNVQPAVTFKVKF